MQVSELFTPEWIAVWLPIALLVGAWAFKVERNTSKTATSNEFIKSALEILTSENKLEHERLHKRINVVDEKVDIHGEKLSVHEERFNNLLGKGGCST